MAEEGTLVLMAGGALTGLSSAVFLAWHGVPCLVVERHPDLLIHPRLRGITPRTVEVYRQVGLESAIRAASFAGGDDCRWVTARAETLASRRYAPAEEQGEESGSSPASPCGFALIDQDKLKACCAPGPRSSARWCASPPAPTGSPSRATSPTARPRP
jgi:putative polyketide hydroxylase